MFWGAEAVSLTAEGQQGKEVEIGRRAKEENLSKIGIHLKLERVLSGMAPRKMRRGLKLERLNPAAESEVMF